ncbi:MAG: response regulator transcription factor [Phycisphaerae bacterium]|nr:response regulator transcription factor [Gemmatimonadaceae bacterium]
MRCVLVEDEPLALERLRNYVSQLPLLQMAAAFDNAGDALAYLLTNPVELLFLDINLGGVSGIELLETSALNCQVILTTAHSDYALKAYDLKVADYLLKPFTFARFVQAVDRAIGNAAVVAHQPDRQYFFVKTEQRLERVRFAELLYIEGDGDYRQVQTLSRRIGTLEKFSELEVRIAPDIACRVHKSYMVALDKVESVERDRIRIRDKFIPVSASYRDAFYARIGFGKNA